MLEVFLKLVWFLYFPEDLFHLCYLRYGDYCQIKQHTWWFPPVWHPDLIKLQDFIHQLIHPPLMWRVYELGSLCVCFDLPVFAVDLVTAQEEKLWQLGGLLEGM